MRPSEVHGGSGFVAATEGDLGYEPALGATSADIKPVRRREQTIEVGEGLSEGRVSSGGLGCGC